jgi:mannan endo-1,4-beta-mannosidase
MNKLSLYSFAVILSSACALGGCSQQATTAKDNSEAENTPRQELLKRFAAVEKTGKYIFGHHDDTAYGKTWRDEPDRSDVLEVVNDYPGIMNWDLGLIEWNCSKELDSVSFNFIHDEIIKQDARGGINTISWHVRNPKSKNDSWDVSAGDVVKECVTEGTALNDTMKVWIGRAAEFIGNLRDKSNRRIPVVFRPWHEHTGTWFWWSAPAYTTPENLVKLWHLTRKVFDEKGIDNVVWAYSPDKITSVEEYMASYPGNEYIDIMGADVYCFGGEEGLEEYFNRANTTLTVATKEAKQHGKFVAWTETGNEGLPMSSWFTRALVPVIEKYPVIYMTTWRNADNKPGHYFVPYKGHPDEQSFVDFYNNPSTLFVKELKDIK